MHVIEPELKCWEESYHLWCEIVRRSTARVRKLSLTPEHSSKPATSTVSSEGVKHDTLPEIGNFHYILLGKHDVCELAGNQELREQEGGGSKHLEITMHDFHAVYVFQRQHNLNGQQNEHRWYGWLVWHLSAPVKNLLLTEVDASLLCLFPLALKRSYVHRPV